MITDFTGIKSEYIHFLPLIDESMNLSFSESFPSYFWTIKKIRQKNRFFKTSKVTLPLNYNNLKNFLFHQEYIQIMSWSVSRIFDSKKREKCSNVLLMFFFSVFPTRCLRLLDEHLGKHYKYTKIYMFTEKREDLLEFIRRIF